MSDLKSFELCSNSHGMRKRQEFFRNFAFVPRYLNCLVVWNHGIRHDFPHIGNFIIPSGFLIFQRGRYTTNQIISTS